MMKFAKLLLILLLIGVMAFSVVGCGQEANTPEPPVNEDPVDNEPPADTLDPQEVAMEAAKTFFAAVADSNNIISSEDLKDMLDANPNSALVIDIRSAEDFEAGHIEGAVHSPWGNVGEIMNRIPKNKPVIVACYSGQTAGQTVGLLRMAGFDNVKSLLSGMKLGWVGGAEFPTDGEGMNAAADLPEVTEPATEEEQILWEKAQEVFADIASGDRALIEPAELKDALDGNPSSFYVLDIRREEDFVEGHIEHSVHSAWAKAGDVLETLPTNRPVVVACYSGQTAGQTVGVLRLLGFDAKSLLYGVREGWVKRAELPLVTE
ncbi:MAG: rhodanese-like domain-containing protein [Bacillota bacterium]|nr:rhodanese-like domain-containing protein [Bacillota bacterium]MDW7684185.1 rhodanese-like domain-containing protein [Bacillota bacterium]